METPYTFDNLSRIGNDTTYLDQESIQNMNACNYTLQNYFSQDCTMGGTIRLATSQPCVFYNGVSSVGESGCLVDENSKMTIGSYQTKPATKVDLYQRPFVTVPYLGRGSVDPVMESQLQQGETITNRRSVNKLGEKTYMNYTTTPMIPSVRERMTNPAYSVESVASDGWVRGGIPSRDLAHSNC